MINKLILYTRHRLLDRLEVEIQGQLVVVLNKSVFDNY